VLKTRRNPNGEASKHMEGYFTFWGKDTLFKVRSTYLLEMRSHPLIRGG
jgi:hypothetical protein